MKINILKVDETAHWSEEIRERVERIWGVYLFDQNWRIHLCEFTPSYELHRLPSQVIVPDWEYHRHDEIEGEIMDGERFDDAVVYVHCHRLDGLDHFKEGWFPDGTMGVCTMTGFAQGFVFDPHDTAERDEREQRHDYAIEEAREYCSQVCV
jgi:hypothetical protein